MTDAPLDQVVHHVRGLKGGAADARTDRELLAAWSCHNDQAAFAELMARHGPMVLAVCRRLLGDPHDADDAFQATFLVLSRKASARGWADSIAGWLHAVAWRVAAKARSRAARLQRHLRELPMSAGTAEAPDELHDLLHAELTRLPEKHRGPLVLCCLQGQTNQQAASALGCPPDSMSKRLARGRDLLRRRLEGKGATVPACGLVGLLGQTAPLAVPAPLLQATLHAGALLAAGQAATGAVGAAAASLAEGALRDMSTQKLRLAFLAAVTALALAAGVGALAYSGQ